MRTLKSTMGLALMAASTAISTNLYTELPSELSEVDIFIAGGGTAGCVVAARLAEKDPSLSILVIEQGSDSFNLSNLADREPIVETGGVLGGGSSINWMVYTRPQWDDFDSWNTSGWATNDVLPYLTKFETYHGLTDKSMHGYDGPIHVSKGTYQAKRAERGFIQGAVKAGYPELVDLQSLHTNNGSGPWYRLVSPDTGRRQDVAHRYLHPLLQSGSFPHLHVLVSTQVLRVLLEGGETKRAVGVEIEKTQASSAGAFGSPLLLERSGIGSPVVLDRAGIPLEKNVPGVGNDFQDHHLVGYVYRTDLTLKETINGIARDSPDRDLRSMIERNDEQLGWNGHDASSKLRPSSNDIAALGPEFEARWERDFKDMPNRPLMIMGLFNCYFGDPATLPDKQQYVTIAPWVTYPYARGHTHVTGCNIRYPYDFSTGRLLDEDDIDLKSHLWGYKTQRAIARRMDIFRGELSSGQPRFPKGSNASVIETADGPILEEIRYSEEDDAAIVQYIRENIGTSRHPMGTCKMAPWEDDGVGAVDPKLNVHGVSSLKVVDLSIVPQQVAANTYSTALMVGEKAANIIAKELGICQ